MKAVAAAIAALDDGLISALLEHGSLSLTVAEEAIEITPDDVEIVSEEIVDWVVAQAGAVTVALDVRIDDELRSQGYAREVINRIQSMRKTADLELTARIVVEFGASSALAGAIFDNLELIRSETLASNIESAGSPSGIQIEEFAIGDENLTVGIAIDSAVQA